MPAGMIIRSGALDRVRTDLVPSLTALSAGGGCHPARAEHDQRFEPETAVGAAPRPGVIMSLPERVGAR
jgi:hypothetical protein